MITSGQPPCVLNPRCVTGEGAVRKLMAQPADDLLLILQALVLIQSLGLTSNSAQAYPERKKLKGTNQT